MIWYDELIWLVTNMKSEIIHILNMSWIIQHLGVKWSFLFLKKYHELSDPPRYLFGSFGSRFGSHGVFCQLWETIEIWILGYDWSYGSATRPGLQVPSSSGHRHILQMVVLQIDMESKWWFSGGQKKITNKNVGHDKCVDILINSGKKSFGEFYFQINHLQLKCGSQGFT